MKTLQSLVLVVIAISHQEVLAQIFDTSELDHSATGPLGQTTVKVSSSLGHSIHDAGVRLLLQDGIGQQGTVRSDGLFTIYRATILLNLETSDRPAASIEKSFTLALPGLCSHCKCTAIESLVCSIKSI